ncbi:hypothetical protein SFC07_11315 [Corynebacterium callunae]|uniref:hypothetical protein n=1 Tax=Corynebacterium callunae TaxID=1721 RepID=UPI003981BFA7
MTHIKLSDAVQIVVRPDSAIQFGIDATRSGVLEIDPAFIAAITSILLHLREPKPVAGVVDKLSAAGLGTVAALSLVEDLLAFGVVRETATAPVLLYGHGTLVDATSALLEAAGFNPRTRINDENSREFFQRPASHILVINRLAHTRNLAPLLAECAPTYLSAALIDSRGLIGPGRRDGVGPCLLCVDLHRSDIDPHWHALVSQHPNGPTHADPIAEAATAARLAALVSADSWLPGEVEEVDPHLGAYRKSHLAPHPRCPLCWG